MVATLNNFFNTKVLPKSFAQGRLILLAKDGKDHRHPASWRPITVLNWDYKIFATVLMKRLKQYWSDVILCQPTSSIVDRNIFSALSLTLDLLAYTEHTKAPGLCVSLDQEHAFDSQARIPFRGAAHA